MKEGNQIASPVFKKRFARRKTTQRPFTFAHNFETEEPLPGAKSPIVSQVGDRGVVITSPVQLSRGPEGPLTISDIVRQSPLPVLIAHSTPGENEREPQSDDNDEDEANTSLLRRSMRSRVPSQQFLSRQQHPHGTPQLSKSQCTPDESYIGSQNASNIDAEVSIVDEEGQTRGGRGRKGSSASSSKSPKQKAKTQTRSKPTDPPTSSARGKAQTRETSQREGSSSSVKDASAAKKSSGRRGASTSAKTSSSRKGRERGSLDRTPPPPPPPSAQKERRNLSDKGKKVLPSPLSKRNKRENVLNSSGLQKSATKVKTPLTSPLKGNRSGSFSPSGRTSKQSLAKRTPQSLRGKGKNESVVARGMDRTLSHSKNQSFTSESRDETSLQEDGDLSASGSNTSKSLSPDFPSHTEKENRPFRKNKEARSPTPSGQRKQSKTDGSTPRKEGRLVLRSGTQDRSLSRLQTNSPPPSKRATQSLEENKLASSSAKKRKTSGADDSINSSVSVRLPTIMEDERGNRSSSVSGNRSGVQVRAKSGKASEPTETPSDARRRKKITPDDDNVGALGPSAKKRARNSQLSEASMAQDRSQKQESRLSSTHSRRETQSVLTSPDAQQSTKKNTRKRPQSENQPQNNSISNSRVSEDGLRTGTNASRTKNAAPQISVSSLSHKRAPSNADSRSPRRGLTSRVVGERSSHRATPPRASRSSSSFWKTSCPVDSTPRTKRKQPAMSQSSLYEDHSLGGREMNRSVAVTCQIPAKKASSSTSRDHRNSEQRSEEEDEEPKRPRSGVTELGVIINILEDTEDDIMEDSAMPEMCQRAVHKAFSFTKRQLQETESQLKEISEAEYQINKLKSTCKTMSGDSKEKLQEKFILQKELQSLKSQGIDADMMHIDQWLQDFQALRLSSN